MQSNAIQADTDFPDELRPGTVLLHGQYVIQSYLVRGGFGITYLARDSLDRIVVVKECFPSTICARVDGRVTARSRKYEKQYATVLRHFIREARRMSKLDHPQIVGVHQVFEERDTAYMALDYVEGNDLLTVLESQPDRLTPQVVSTVLRKILGAVTYIHDMGILHRDISPDNILLDDDNNPTLIDFGAAREDATRENRELSALLTVKDGYSPQEFYLSDEPQRLPSDLYSLGATFFHILTGEAPPHSQQRLAAVAGRGDDPYRPLVSRVAGYDADFLAAIDKSLEIFPDDRFQSAQEWIDAIAGSLRRAETAARSLRDADMLRAISELIGTGEPAAGGAHTASEPRRATDAAGAPRKAQDAPRVASRKVAPAQFVDMFGNPVEDVDSWLAEQERDLKRRKADERKARNERTEPRPEVRGGFLRSLLGLKAPQSARRMEN